MTRRAAFGLRANRHVAGAFEWYEQQRAGLGSEFLSAVDEAIELLQQMPELGHVVHRDLRRLSLRRFPYVIYYRITGSSVRIRACLHERRDARVRETHPSYTAATLRSRPMAQTERRC